MTVQFALLYQQGKLWSYWQYTFMKYLLCTVGNIHGGQLNGDIIYYKSYTIYCDIQFTFHKVVGDGCKDTTDIANVNIHSNNKGCINTSELLFTWCAPDMLQPLKMTRQTLIHTYLLVHRAGLHSGGSSLTSWSLLGMWSGCESICNQQCYSDLLWPPVRHFEELYHPYSDPGCK